MNLLDYLHDKLEKSPTILDFKDEIYFIENLSKLTNEEIIENKDKFLQILKAIQISHQDNGIFEITDENIDIFFNFVIWLREVQHTCNFTNLDKYFDGLDTNFDGTKHI